MALKGQALVAVLILLFCFSKSAEAEEFLLETPDGLLSFQSAQDRIDYINWVKSGGRTVWLFFLEQMMKPCIQKEDEACHRNMMKVRSQEPVQLKNARLVVSGRQDRFLMSVRNGNFLYAAAPSFQLLHSIVGRPGNCATWSASANRLLSLSAGALSRLSDEAERELPTGSDFPERRLLDGVDKRPGLLDIARGCGGI